MYKLAIYGYGGWGKNYYKTLENHSKGQVVKVFSNSMNAPWQSRREDVFKEVNYDALLICCPPQEQPAIIRQCIDRKIPFLAQKPFCLSEKEALSLAGDAVKANLPMMVDNTQLYNPAFLYLNQQIEDKKIDAIFTEVHGNQPCKNVNVVWDWLPHDIYMTLAISKQYPSIIETAYQQAREQGDKCGKLTVKLQFPDFKADINIRNDSYCKTRKFAVRCGNEWHIASGDVYMSVINGTERFASFETPRPLENMFKYFFKILKGEVYDDLKLSVNTTKIVESASNILRLS